MASKQFVGLEAVYVGAPLSKGVTDESAAALIAKFKERPSRSRRYHVQLLEPQQQQMAPGRRSRSVRVSAPTRPPARKKSRGISLTSTTKRWRFTSGLRNRTRASCTKARRHSFSSRKPMQASHSHVSNSQQRSAVV